MPQNEELKGLDLIDVAHFFLLRWKKICVVTVVIFSIIFGGIVAKRSFYNDPQRETYEAVILVEIPQILWNTGHARPVVSPNLLIGTYQSESVNVSSVAGAVSDNPPNGVWVMAKAPSREQALTLVKHIANEIVSNVDTKTLQAKQSKARKYSVIGSAHIAKTEVIELVKSDFTIKVLIKIMLVSLFLGGLISLIYVGFEKFRLDYRERYPA